MRKIAILGSKGIPASYGGFETFAEELSVRLCREGYEVTVYCEGKANRSNFQGVRLVHMAVPRLGPVSTLMFDFLSIVHAVTRNEVIYMLGYASAAFLFIGRALGRAVWVNPDGFEWKRAKWGRFARLWLRVMERMSLMAATCLVADSRAVRNYMRRKYGRNVPIPFISYGCRLVHSPPDASHLSRFGLMPEKYVLVVARIEPENNILEILDGYLRSSMLLPLVVIGNINAHSEYAEKVRSLRSDNIIFLGPVFDKEGLRCLRYYSRCYIHGHSVGGTNPSLLEALGAGNVILAHDNEFNREVAGDCASYFTTREDLVSHLSTVFRDYQGVHTAHRERCMRRARERYCWEDITMKYISLLRMGPVRFVAQQEAAEENSAGK